jgi:inner membrane protein
MDILTQMLLGGVVGQVGFRRTLGRRAIVAGALLGAVPDMDVVVGMVGGPFATWVHHRGLTHSLLFGPLAGPLIGKAIAWAGSRRKKPAPAYLPEKTGSWMWLATLVLFTHPLIDTFTSYGTQLLWPLTDTRFAINAMSIIDPVYSLALIIALMVGMIGRVTHGTAVLSGALALLFITLYSLGGWAVNTHVEQVARQQIDNQADVEASPLLFQPWFRRVVAFSPDVVRVGYYSVLNPRPIEWTDYNVERSPAIDAVRSTREGRIFEWFSGGRTHYTARPSGDGYEVRATDMRYGMKGATDAGFWGIRANVGADNAIIGKVEQFGVPRQADGDAFRQFWHDLTGR